MPLLNLFKTKQQTTSQMERRLEERHPSHFSAIIDQPDKEAIATVLNFSKSGLALLSTTKIPPDELFNIELAFNSERTIQTTFKSIHCQQVESGYLIRAKLVKPCQKYQNLVTKITQPKHSVISDCW